MNSPTAERALAPDTSQRATTLSQQLAEFAAGFAYDAIPESIRQRAKYLILDAVGIALASTQYDFAHRVLSGIRALAGSGDCSVIGMPERLPLRDAVLMNGVLVHGLDYDDTHIRAIVHPTASAFTCALGVAEQLDRSGRDLLAAYVLGVETVTRICDAAKGHFHHFGFHPTGLAAHFSCALQAGRLYGLTPAQLAVAQGIAGSTAAASQEFLEEGAWNKRLHPGWAAAAGITAANLARGGFVAPTKPYEGRFGLYKSHLAHLEKEVNYGAITAGLGKTWEILGVAIKPYPVCHLIHACADAALLLREKHRLTPSRIAKVTALVPSETLHLIAEPLASKLRPASDYDAKFSVQYLVAACLVRGRFGLAELEADARNNAEILALAQKVEAAADPESTFPNYFSGGVVIRTSDGREFRHHEPVNRGAGDRALTAEEIEAKYWDNARLALPERRAREIRDVVLDVDRLTAREVAQALAGR
ncbi:MAG: MmgE/PrpD family protein [Betaproteobacteria bacterium]|nr:MmgE/PrpD family protein [Betaproteobacteria bacterium]